jgi:hypothetical protein
MRKPSKQFHPLMASGEPEPEVVYTDDGGSGLLDACKTRFASADYEVKCDARHTVWVKRADGTRSVGLPPWLLRRQSLDEVLERVETKLGILPVPER